jgi:hypothetical protein
MTTTTRRHFLVSASALPLVSSLQPLTVSAAQAAPPPRELSGTPDFGIYINDSFAPVQFDVTNNYQGVLLVICPAPAPTTDRKNRLLTFCPLMLRVLSTLA